MCEPATHSPRRAAPAPAPAAQTQLEPLESLPPLAALYQPDPSSSLPLCLRVPRLCAFEFRACVPSSSAPVCLRVPRLCALKFRAYVPSSSAPACALYTQGGSVLLVMTS